MDIKRLTPSSSQYIKKAEKIIQNKMRHIPQRTRTSKYQALDQNGTESNENTQISNNGGLSHSKCDSVNTTLLSYHHVSIPSYGGEIKH